MGNPILILRLEAPMQSWGTRARWDVRDTGPEPTKSGVVGLLGCASGLRRGDPDLERFDAALTFGVRIDRAGQIATDYHTVTGRHRMANGKLKKDEYTVQSDREYLHDAEFLVALASDDAALLERLAGHLAQPKWPLYLGRKACVPTRPILDRLTDEYDDLEDALTREPWSIRTGAAPPTPATLDAWIECTDGEHERQDVLRVDELRFYEFRRCRRIRIDASTLPRRSA